MRGWDVVLTNARITIFNKRPDPKSKKFLYYPHKIPDVWFHCSHKTEIQQGSLVSVNEYKIRIPFPQENWIEPPCYQNLMEVGESWTVQKGDFFMVGEWEEGCVEGITHIKKNFPGIAGVVQNYSENFTGLSPHIRISGGD